MHSFSLLASLYVIFLSFTNAAVLDRRSSTCDAGDVAIVKQQVTHPVYFCTWYLSDDRTRSPIPVLTVFELETACKCITSSAAKQTISHKITTTGKLATCKVSDSTPIRDEFKNFAAFCSFYNGYPRTDSPIASLDAQGVLHGCNCVLAAATSTSVTTSKTSTKKTSSLLTTKKASTESTASPSTKKTSSLSTTKRATTLITASPLTKKTSSSSTTKSISASSKSVLSSISQTSSKASSSMSSTKTSATSSTSTTSLQSSSATQSDTTIETTASSSSSTSSTSSTTTSATPLPTSCVTGDYFYIRIAVESSTTDYDYNYLVADTASGAGFFTATSQSAATAFCLDAYNHLNTAVVGLVATQVKFSSDATVNFNTQATAEEGTNADNDSQVWAYCHVNADNSFVCSSAQNGYETQYNLQVSSSDGSWALLDATPSGYARVVLAAEPASGSHKS